MKSHANQLYLTVDEVATWLRVKPSTVRWLIRTQQLSAAQRVADEFLIGEWDLVAFIAANTIRNIPSQRTAGPDERLAAFCGGGL